MSSENRKVLFAHDGPLYFDQEGNYYGIHLTDNLKNRYLELGQQVTFVIRTKPIPAEAGNQFSQITNDKFRVVDIPNYKSFSKYFSLRKKAEKIIEKAVLEHDVIVVRLPSGSGAIAVKYAKKHKKPLLAEMVACTWDAYWNYSWKGKLVAPYFFIRLKNRLKKLPYVIYVTREFLQKRYPTNGKQINISNVELSQIKEGDLINRLKKIETWDGRTPLMLSTIAALNVPYKGQADVIKALAILKKRGCIFHYKLVGGGNPTRLKDLIAKLDLKKEVEFVGQLPHEKIFDFLEEIDIYIQPSKTEGLPRAVIEAMSKACPVVGTNAGGIPELISPEYIFRKGNLKQIADILSGIEKNTLGKMALENFESAKNYVPEVLQKRRSDFYTLFLKENFPNEKI